MKPLGLFALLAGVALIAYHGGLQTSDEQLMAATTASIADSLSLTFDREIHGQFFTGYGLGTPIAGVPAYLAEKALRHVAAFPDGSIFMPLTNVALFGFLGVLLASFLEGERRWLLTALVLFASPFLPMATTFQSEMLATVGLVGLTACLFRSCSEKPPWHALAGACVFALAATTARLAMVPLLGLVLIWGWRIGAHRATLLLGAAGTTAGIAIAGIVNYSLRGSPFATGYEGQDFTTPLLTGLYGLLVSPERGILIFFPALVIPIIGFSALGGRARSLLVLAASLTIFSAVFHGQFWTWHGGWSTGPRFLLPAVALYVPCLVSMLQRHRDFPRGLAIATGVALFWAAILNVIYMQHSAIAWWNKLFVLHGQENQWLLLPQLSLWQAWFDGVPLDHVKDGLTKSYRVAFVSLGITLIALSLYPLVMPFRTRIASDAPPRPAMSRRENTAFIAAGAYLLFLFLASLLMGPRGWSHHDRDDAESHLLLDWASGTYRGILDFSLHGNLELSVKSNAEYRIAIDGQTAMSQDAPAGYQMARQTLGGLTPGKYDFEVTVIPVEIELPAVFELYWTWPGGGRYLAPAGGQYVYPRELTASERFFTFIWRRKFPLTAAILALVLLLGMLPRAKREGSRRDAALSP